MKRNKKPHLDDETIERVDSEGEGAEHEGTPTAGEPLSEASLLPSVPKVGDLRTIAVTPGLQALWAMILPLVGVLPSKPGEFPGIFKVEPGPAEGEATVHIDIPSKPYEPGKPSTMNRIVTLKVELAHDYRLLGERYYCVDCEIPTNETSH